MPRTHSLSRAEIVSLGALRHTTYKGLFVVLLVYSTPHLPHLKSIGVVSKKVAPHAVDRNRIKRRIREIVRQFISQHNTPKKTIIIRATPAAAKTDTAALRAELEPLLVRAIHTTNNGVL